MICIDKSTFNIFFKLGIDKRMVAATSESGNIKYIKGRVVLNRLKKVVVHGNGDTCSGSSSSASDSNYDSDAALAYRMMVPVVVLVDRVTLVF